MYNHLLKPLGLDINTYLKIMYNHNLCPEEKIKLITVNLQMEK